MIRIIQENNYYFIGNYSKNLYGVEYNYCLGQILGVDNNIIHAKFENDFNATWDNCYNHTIAGFRKLNIGFKNLSDAERALEWIKSIELLNKLG